MNIPTKGTDDEVFDRLVWEQSWTYIKNVVDTVRQPFLILDEKLCVKFANDAFYEFFETSKESTEAKHVYELGNGQWDIASLRNLLEDILPKDTSFKGFEVTHTFPSIGRKVMMLNALRIYKEHTSSNLPPIILLAMEDITEYMRIAQRLASKTGEIRKQIDKKIHILELQVESLEAKLREARL